MGLSEELGMMWPFRKRDKHAKVKAAYRSVPPSAPYVLPSDPTPSRPRNEKYHLRHSGTIVRVNGMVQNKHRIPKNWDVGP